MSESITLVGGITLAIAVLGAVLGVINTWIRISQDRVKLRVAAQHSVLFTSLGTSPWHLSIQIVNLSSFPLKIVEVGLEPGRVRKSKLTIPSPMLADSGGWPRKLEPREAVTIICAPDLALHPELKYVKRAYARTECGTICSGSTPALRQYVDESISKE